MADQNSRRGDQPDSERRNEVYRESDLLALLPSTNLGQEESVSESARFVSPSSPGSFNSHLSKRVSPLIYLDKSYSMVGPEAWSKVEEDVFAEWNPNHRSSSFPRELASVYYNTCKRSWPWSPSFSTPSGAAISHEAKEYAAHYSISCAQNEEMKDLVRLFDEYRNLDVREVFDNNFRHLQEFASKNNHMFVDAASNESLHSWCTALRDPVKKESLTSAQHSKLTKFAFEFDSHSESSVQVFLRYHQTFIRECSDYGSPVSLGTTQWFLDRSKAAASKSLHPAMKDVLQKCHYFVSLSGVFVSQNLTGSPERPHASALLLEDISTPDRNA